MIYTPADPLPNRMELGDYYEGCSSGPDTCAVCGGQEHDMRETHMGPVCSSCRRLCSYCHDWLLTDATVLVDGHEMHKRHIDDKEIDNATEVRS